MPIIEKSAVLVRQDKTNEVHIYPITTADNIIINETEQLDEYLLKMENKLNDIENKSMDHLFGSSIPEASAIKRDTLFFKIEKTETA